MSGSQQRAAALARWAALSPEQRREATRPGTEASRAKAVRAAKRAAERQAAEDRSVLSRVRPETVAEARRIVGPDATDRELVRQVLLVIAAHRAAGHADPDPITERNTSDDRRQNEEGVERANARPQEANGHRRVEGKP